MYVVNLLDLKQRINFTLMYCLHDMTREDEEELMVSLTEVALDLTLSMVNDKTGEHPDDMFDRYIKMKYPDVQHVFGIGEIVTSLVIEIRKRFFTEFGHDKRLMYKLVRTKRGRTPIYYFAMDLEFTFECGGFFQPSQEDLTQEVDDNPSLETMNELFTRAHY
ncbi:hypothetical protein D6_0037 [Aeromonas phage D6]|uniref:Uncharacterized protein n=2 Tax=Ludhianavirus TaxID=3044751 RepID=A0A514A1M1_9CAUD|nr:hypothetical protein PQC06_gp204 [Aeromonas phage LAh10]YP_010668785.1 hypothetical protein PQC08_gp238 [Aeromonas phage D6]QDH47171.1 hypothetical protein LAh10_203 [Aeromonas phage LAh10]QDJ97197.1 hypothetical protein D6_0037 [Aeromonas phage D6]